MKFAIASCVTALALGLLSPAAGFAQASGGAPGGPPTSVPPNDYGKSANWLCRPGHEEACSRDLTATVVQPGGQETKDVFHPAADPGIDCFYVYPTVSRDPTPNSDMTPGPEEFEVVNQQFARFASVCRLYAPVYRQVTLTALQATMLGHPMAADRALAYHDVRDAWREYLAHDNHGRGVVLIGHSQGSGVLTQLIKDEIDGQPVQKRLVSALLLGTSLPVPKGADVGGAFKAVPLCRSQSQVGCVVAFASFRASAPPPADSRFGRATAPGMAAACVNPAAPGGGEAPLHAFLATDALNIAGAETSRTEWVKGGPPIATPFVEVPGLLSAKCVSDEHGSYLAVTVHGDPADPRADDIVGDVVIGGHVLPDWGLHLIDANLTMGDLLTLVADETRAYMSRR